MTDFDSDTPPEETPPTAIPGESNPAATEASTPDPQIEKAAELAGRIRDEIKRVVIGQDEEVEQILMALLAAGHVLIEGVPGLGKTLLVLALAKTFGGRFSRVQFTPDLMPSDVTGHVVFDGESNTFRVRRGPAFTNMLLADEINRAPAKTQSSLLEVMQEGQITIEGEVNKLEPPFMTIATQNPIEQEGTYPLPEAQLDRFLIKVRVDYPDLESESRIVAQVTSTHVGESLNVNAINEVASLEEVLEMQRITASLTVSPRVVDYAVRIVRETRSWRGILMGAGPRGAIAMVRVARAHALLDGRSFVTPDDIKAVAHTTLRHRMMLAPELELEGLSTDDILTSILGEVEAPRQ
jgi:MoxR-like ATPase